MVHSNIAGITVAPMEEEKQHLLLQERAVQTMHLLKQHPPHTHTRTVSPRYLRIRLKVQIN